jgi:hypothetical protein
MVRSESAMSDTLDKRPREPLAPRRPFQETAWRFVEPSGRVVVCRIAAIPHTIFVEVRMVVHEDDPEGLIKTQVTASPDSARALAEAWKYTIKAKGGVTAASLMDDTERSRHAARLLALESKQRDGNLNADEAVELEVMQADDKAMLEHDLQALTIRVNTWREAHGYPPLPPLGPLAPAAALRTGVPRRYLNEES